MVADARDGECGEKRKNDELIANWIVFHSDEILHEKHRKSAIKKRWQVSRVGPAIVVQRYADNLVLAVGAI